MLFHQAIASFYVVAGESKIWRLEFFGLAGASPYREITRICEYMRTSYTALKGRSFGAFP